MSNIFDITTEVLAAESRIRPYVRETPLDYSIALSRMTGSQVYLKCENLQYTGAFKVRGAVNALLQLKATQSAKTIVTASSGNHGAAIAYALKALNMQGIVFVPENVSTTKVDNIRHYDAHLEYYALDSMLTELHALEYAKANHCIYVSPYDNQQVIAGQGTIGLELLRQLDHIDVVLVPVGGGGLISGIAGYLKNVAKHIKVIGCMPENSPVMYESIKAGHIIDMPTKPTLSDATAGGIAPGSITFELCQQYVDDYICVSEQEIKQAIVSLLKTQHLLVEGAAGVALASFIKNAQQFRGKHVAIVLSGANISLDTLKTVLN